MSKPRKTNLFKDERLLAEFYESINKGLYPERAATAIFGMDAVEFRERRRAAVKTVRDGGRRNRETRFFEEVFKAEAQQEAMMVEQWEAHTIADWRAARSFLERRYPARWSLRQGNPVEDSDEDTGIVPLKLSLTDNQEIKPLVDDIEEPVDEDV